MGIAKKSKIFLAVASATVFFLVLFVLLVHTATMFATGDLSYLKIQFIFQIITFLRILYITFYAGLPNPAK